MKTLLLFCIVLLSFSSCKKCYVCTSNVGNSTVSTTFCPGDALYDQAKTNSACTVKEESTI